MELNIPPEIRRFLAANTTARLVAGTYSMRGADMITVGKKQVQDNAVIFRPFNAAAGTRDTQIEIGTLNPSAMMQGNQIVLLLVDTVPTNNIFDEFMRWRRGKMDGAQTAVACWVPDGGSGRYMVEQEDLFINYWFGEGKETSKQRVRLTLAIIATVVATTIATSLLAPFLLFVGGPFLAVALAGFAGYKVRRYLIDRGLLLGHREAQRMIYDWCATLLEDGTFAGRLQKAIAPEAAPLSLQQSNSLLY